MNVIAKKKLKPETDDGEAIAIKEADFRAVDIEIVGTAPLMINRFSEKMKLKMLADHVAGSSKTGKRKAKPAKDVDMLFETARYRSKEGWDGIAASSLRNALIRTCSIVGFKMTAGKQSLFIIADGYDELDGTPLVRIWSDEVPAMDERITRNSDGSPDVRIRPRWDAWGMVVRVQFDADVFTPSDVTNLVVRAGVQNGLGEGRPFSKNGNGIGFGTFRVRQGSESARLPVSPIELTAAA